MLGSSTISRFLDFPLTARGVATSTVLLLINALAAETFWKVGNDRSPDHSVEKTNTVHVGFQARHHALLSLPSLIRSARSGVHLDESLNRIIGVVGPSSV